MIASDLMLLGGEGGQEALARLKQTFSRVESSWRPASQEESYEIVRRRLFKDIPGDKFHHRDNTLKQFAKLYRENAATLTPDPLHSLFYDSHPPAAIRIGRLRAS